MKSEKINRLIVIITVLSLVFTINSVCFANEEDTNLVTNDFELSSYGSINNEVTYGVYVKNGDENKLLSVEAKDYNLPTNLYDYKDYVSLRITYSQEDYKIHDCKVINNKTGEIIEDLSEENINKLFNIEYGKNITEKVWCETIKLSELKENEIYKYTANSTVQFPKIENDIGKNCIIYIKERDNTSYERKVNMSKVVAASSLSFSYNEYNAGETFSIMYSTIENDELLKLIKKDKIIYLSNYNDGDKLKYDFEEYIYNDTGEDIKINIQNLFFGEEESNSFEIRKGEICGFDCKIDSATISYIEDNINEENDTKTEEKDNQNKDIEIKKDSNDNQQDNTIASSKLPNTGLNIIIYLIVLFNVCFIIIFSMKLRKYKDVK